jgi:hypothetical protein
MVLRTLAVLVLCATSAGLAPAQEKGASQRETFEELLARARAQRDALQDRLGADVKDRVAR